MTNKSHDYYTPSEISKMNIDKELDEAYEMNYNRSLSHNEAWDVALQEQR
jgi:hypothetical protein